MAGIVMQGASCSPEAIWGAVASQGLTLYILILILFSVQTEKPLKPYDCDASKKNHFAKHVNTEGEVQALIQKSYNRHLHLADAFLPKATDSSVIHTYIHTLILVAAMQGADKHIKSSLGHSILPKDTSTCRPGESNQRPSNNNCHLYAVVFLLSVICEDDPHERYATLPLIIVQRVCECSSETFWPHFTV